MKILNYGSCNIDYVYHLAHITAPGETNCAPDLSLYPGGKGLNQSVAIARAGVPVSHAGAIGEDGAFLRDLLAQEGVDLTYLSQSKERTGHAIIQVDDAGANAIIVYGGANETVQRPRAAEILSHFGAGDILTVQNEINEVPYLLHMAHERGMQTFYNPSPFNDRARAVDLADVTCLVVNEGEGQALSPFQEPQELAAALHQRYPALQILLTLGEKGSLFMEPGRCIACPACPAQAVDTTAAGDTFTGYFIASRARGYDLEMAMHYASAAASLAVSRPGASASIPQWGEVVRAVAAWKK